MSISIWLGWMATCGLLARAESGKSGDDGLTYTGMCDASAAVAVGNGLFAVANDEDNRIRLYHRDQGGPPVRIIDLSPYLRLDPKSPETDLEAAAKIGDRIYWLSSHGRNRVGKERINRHRFFATTCRATADGIRLEFIGLPYQYLLNDLIAAPQLRKFKLAKAAEKAPKVEGALNLEGLCATPDGRLLIGFRSPNPGGRALLVPLNNPNEVIQGRPAGLGEPILLDLKGLGIRDITFWEGQYLIIAGPAGPRGRFRLYRWTGGAASPRQIKGDKLDGLNPEAIVVYPDLGGNRIQLLSDDGMREIQGVPCKDLPNPNQRCFRSTWVKLQ